MASTSFFRRGTVHHYSMELIDTAKHQHEMSFKLKNQFVCRVHEASGGKAFFFEIKELCAQFGKIFLGPGGGLTQPYKWFHAKKKFITLYDL